MCVDDSGGQWEEALAEVAYIQWNVPGGSSGTQIPDSICKGEQESAS